MTPEDLSDPSGQKRSTASRFAGFAVRVVSAVILVLIIVILLWWGEIPFMVGISLIALGGLWEFYSTFSRHGYKPAMLLSMAAGSALPVIAFFLRDSQDLAPLALALALYLPVLFAWCIFRRGSESPTTDISVSLLGVVMVGFCLSHFVLMLGLDAGIPWTVPFTIIVMVWVCDAVAYLAGSAIGRHKMAPRISPGKSWEGFVGGTIAAMAVAFFATSIALTVLATHRTGGSVIDNVAPPASTGDAAPAQAPVNLPAVSVMSPPRLPSTRRLKPNGAER